MTVNLEIMPEVEALLRDNARRRGLALDAYLLDLAQRDAAPETETTESAGEVAADKAQANAIWADMIGDDDARRDSAIITLAQAPAAVRAIVMQRSAEAAASYYASPKGQAEWEEMADWRALDGEDFLGFEEDANGAANESGAV